MQPIFITATNTDVGKTYTTLKLIELLSNRGISVGVYKPIETGVINHPLDAQKLLHSAQQFNQNFKDLTPKDITAYTFSLPSAPFCADTTKTINIKTLIEKYHHLSKLCDILLIEGAGGLLVPITKELKMIDLIKKFNAKVLLVTPSRLGCINETLLSMEALKTRNIPFEWCVNIHEDKENFHKVTQPYYDEVFSEWWSIDKGIKGYVQSL